MNRETKDVKSCSYSNTHAQCQKIFSTVMIFADSVNHIVGNLN